MDASDASALLDLIEFTDGLVEKVVLERRSLSRAMDALLPALAARLGADAFAIRTYGEDLCLHTFTFPPGFADPAIDRFLAANERDRGHAGTFHGSPQELVGQSLDVAGTWFGSACVLVQSARVGDVGPERVRRSLRAVCEQLDNYLFALRAAREKHKVVSELSRALQHRVLSAGLAEAVRIISGHVNLAKIIIVLRSDAGEDAAVHVQAYEGARLVADTMHGDVPADEAAALRTDARAYVAGKSKALLQRFDFKGVQEEVLIHGVKETTLVGKIAVSSEAGDFNTYDRELLTAFGDFICQRVVDFNKEYRNLARSFRAADVDRMLQRADYTEQWLRPRERAVGMLFVDVSGFTRVCEQVLVDPQKIGRLVDVWGAHAVDLIWHHGGVFDKMVGDCVIGLFGPPFYERSAGDLLADAMRAALAIRDMTRALPDKSEFAELRKDGLGVSAGVNFAPLFVGTFGPNENFTGFSSGMNNAARLQGLASKDEVLVMDEAIARVPENNPFVFGELRSGKAKNVALPLQFRSVELRADES